jgi:hypothetical protein
MIFKEINFQGRCQTTAMGIMPHADMEKALELSLSLDIPFWPQLPNVSYYEDMYAQASEYFPGIMVDIKNKRISFDSREFEHQLTTYSEKILDPTTFSLSEKYSVVYHHFLNRNLRNYTAIRGQLIGPVSFGFKVADENNMPIIYHEQVRALLFDFFKQKINAQYREMHNQNDNAFVWLDEPGLGWVFSGLSGYNDQQAKREYQGFVQELDSPGALHLCAKVNLPYLLELGAQIVSFDAYQLELMPIGYTSAVVSFLNDGGLISWGIVPPDSTALETETPQLLADRLTNYWKVIANNSKLSLYDIATQALIAPARCCLKNIGQVGAHGESVNKDKPTALNLSSEEQVVEMAFSYLKETSQILKDRFKL